MKPRVIYGVVVLVLTANFLIGAHVYLHAAQAAQKDDPYPPIELFSFVIEKVRKEYVDGQKLTYRDLVYGALKGMLNTLDPHSEFMEPDKYKQLQNDTQGAFGGLGIIVSLKDSFLTVASPMAGTPGLKAGILAGDRIIKIDGRLTEKMSLDEAVKNLRGEPGTQVRLTVLRPSTSESKDYTLTRAVINVDMVTDLGGKKDYPLDENKIGYVRLTQFGERTSEDLEFALKRMKQQRLQGLILDLRWNPGGLLDQAVDVCEKFLPKGQLIVTTEGRSPGQGPPRYATRHDEIEGVPIVVLVNLNSASASEIVAGCLQDLKRAIILGEKTFGKGSVQSIIPLQDGSAIRLTTAKYYTPSHKVIHEEGITPDIAVALTPEEDRAVLTEHTAGALEGLDDKERQRVLATPDPQMERAVDLLKGIALFTQRSPLQERQVAKSEKMAGAK